uniref:Uncharacterized protein n=1 Tax=Oryza meridionalis TaxID=40149 RepID=A0A0E0CT23_9ORYZ
MCFTTRSSSPPPPHLNAGEHRVLEEFQVVGRLEIDLEHPGKAESGASAAAADAEMNEVRGPVGPLRRRVVPPEMDRLRWRRRREVRGRAQRRVVVVGDADPDTVLVEAACAAGELIVACSGRAVAGEETEEDWLRS